MFSLFALSFARASRVRLGKQTKKEKKKFGSNRVRGGQDSAKHRQFAEETSKQASKSYSENVNKSCQFHPPLLTTNRFCVPLLAAANGDGGDLVVRVTKTH